MGGERNERLEKRGEEEREREREKEQTRKGRVKRGRGPVNG